MPKSAHFNSNAPAPSLYLGPEEWGGLKERLTDPFFEALYHRAVETLETILLRRKEEPDRPVHHRLAKAIVISRGSAATSSWPCR